VDRGRRVSLVGSEKQRRVGDGKRVVHPASPFLPGRFFLPIKVTLGGKKKRGRVSTRKMSSFEEMRKRANFCPDAKKCSGRMLGANNVAERRK